MFLSGKFTIVAQCRHKCGCGGMADAIDLGSIIRKGVGVRVPSTAENGAILNQETPIYFFKKVVAVVVKIAE